MDLQPLADSKQFLSETADLYILLNNLVHLDFSYRDSARNARDLGKALFPDQWTGSNAETFKKLTSNAYLALKRHHDHVEDLFRKLKSSRVDVSDAQTTYYAANKATTEHEALLRSRIGPPVITELKRLKSVEEASLKNLQTKVTNAASLLNSCLEIPPALKSVLAEAEVHLERIGFFHKAFGKDNFVEPPTAVLLELFDEDAVNRWARALYQGSPWASWPVSLNFRTFSAWVTSSDFKKISKGNFTNLKIVEDFLFSKGKTTQTGKSLAERFGIGKWLKRVNTVGTAITIADFAMDIQQVSKYIKDFHREWSDAIGPDLYDTFFRAKVDSVLNDYSRMLTATTTAQWILTAQATVRAMALCVAVAAPTTGPGALGCVVFGIGAGVVVDLGSDKARDFFGLSKEEYLPVLLENALEYGYLEMKQRAGAVESS